MMSNDVRLNMSKGIRQYIGITENTRGVFCRTGKE